ncbi:neurogenic locus notch homolog protein 4 isoform X2 [Mauremys mutica]|uniref:neurogenic locus notch homolog protein 4 isoform X2 n=1 Tax=Mauremys mutica TaxID=74926 RepID=UPI001D169475|nr:neurogenic locus notch homolog protein 4 isoform X2 [Mauremys mutica]
MGWIFCRVVKLPRATSHPIFHHFIPSTTGNQITEMLPAPPAPGSCPPAWQDSWVLCAHSGAGWLRPHWAPGCDCAVGEIPRLGGQRGAEGGPAPLSRDTGVCTGGLSRDKDPWARCSRGSGRGGGPGRGGLRVCGCSDPPVHLSPHSGLTCARDPCVNGGTCLAHPDGSRSCLCPPSFVGELCQFQDPCRPGRCQNGGTCFPRLFHPSEPPTYTCSCPPGFTGDECQGAVGDPCFPSPCQKRGTCQRLPSAQYRCLCMEGWTGKNCQLMDFCPTNPCANGGTCLLTYPHIVCQCRPGFDGHTCQHDVNECYRDPGPCANGGTCLNSLGSFRCLCPPGFSGPQCQHRAGPCSAGLCLHGGTCRPLAGGYHGCQCPPGFTGQLCEVNPDDCVGHQCRNGGACQDGLGTYSCLCPPGWTGWDCSGDEDECLAPGPPPCHHGGTCHNLPGGFRCVCVNGWSGASCTHNVDDCVSATCFPGATCLDRVGTFLCQCPPGRTGLLCHVSDACLSSPCHAEASCDTNPLTGSAVCMCQPGSTGPTCHQDLDECQLGAEPCEHGGRCENAVGSFRCRCPAGYTGSRCEADVNECLSQPCLRGAPCLDLLGRFQCLCPPGFQGPTCEREADACASHPCGNGGRCQAGAGAFRCHCPPGFEGPRCLEEAGACASDPCRGGTCLEVAGGFSCLCPPGFSGPDCAPWSDACSRRPCAQGTCQTHPQGALCVCAPGWTGQDCSAEIDPCDSGPCPQGATCQPRPHGYTCTCPQGFTGVRCAEELDGCRGGPCRNGGTCQNSPVGYLCLCPPGFSGERCESDLDQCVPNPCRNGGSCLDGAGAFACLCPPGFSGENCQTPLPPRCPPCQNGGRCQLGGPSPPRCRCPPAWGGALCQEPQSPCQAAARRRGAQCESVIDSCQSNPCANGGTCAVTGSTPSDFTCRCPPGYSGATCDVQLPPCGSHFCHHDGVCVQHPAGPRCLCPGGYGGPGCLQPRPPAPCPPGGSACPQPGAGGPCGELAGDGVCHPACSSPSSAWDGGDCSLGVLDPWAGCPEPCQPGFRDGRCHPQCDSEACLYDGYDCRPPAPCSPAYAHYCHDHFANGHCDRGCLSPECGWDGGDCAPGGGGTLGLAAALPPPALPGLLYALALALRVGLSPRHDPQGRPRLHPYTGREGPGGGNRTGGWPPLGSPHPAPTAAGQEGEMDPTGSVVFLVVDGSRCAGRCLTTPESARRFLGALAASNALGALTPHPLAAVWVEEASSDPQASAPRLPWPLLGSLLAGGLALALGGVLGLRLRRRGARKQGGLWLPAGFARPRDPNARRRRDPVGEDAIGLKPLKLEPEFEDDGQPSPQQIEADAPPSEQDCRHWTPKHLSPQCIMLTPPQEEDPEGRDLDARGPDGVTPLMAAVCAGGAVGELLAQGARLDAQTDATGETALHLAARFARASAVRSLLDAGADPNARDRAGRSPLHSAIGADALGACQLLIRCRQTDLDARMSDGATPLIRAARLAVESGTEELLRGGAAVNAADKWGKTALHWAAAVNNAQAALALLRSGASKDAQDNRAQTPLFLAAREGSADVARLLLRHRASRQLPDELGHLPRDAALARAHHDLLRLLDDPRLGPPPCRPPRLRPLPEEPEPPAPCLAPRRPWAPGQSDGAPVQ